MKINENQLEPMVMILVGISCSCIKQALYFCRSNFFHRLMGRYVAKGRKEALKKLRNSRKLLKNAGLLGIHSLCYYIPLPHSTCSCCYMHDCKFK